MVPQTCLSCLRLFQLCWGIHFVTATWISNFYLLPYTTFTFIYYLYSFRHNYLEISLSFTTLIRFTTCHEQFSLSFTTWIRSDFSQCFTSFSQVFTRFSPLFHHCLNSVSKMLQKCLKVVCLHWSNRSYLSIRRACFITNKSKTSFWTKSFFLQ